MQAYQVMEWLYRQRVSPEETVSETRLNTERMLRVIQVCGLLVTTPSQAEWCSRPAYVFANAKSCGISNSPRPRKSSIAN